MSKIFKVKVRDIPEDTRISTPEHTDSFCSIIMKDETEVIEMEGCPNWFRGVSRGLEYYYHRDWLIFEKKEKVVKLKNDEVVRKWKNGEAGKSDSLTSTGNNLYSYDLLIGFTSDEGKVIKHYVAPLHFQSMITSKHVKLAERSANVIIEPEEDVYLKEG